MIKNKHIVSFIAVLLCATLLTFSAGRVTRVKAVVTEAAVIGGVALIVGTAFLGYLALTGAYVQYTDIDTRNDYVTDVGKWVIENCNGIGISKLIAQASDWVGRQALSAGTFVVEYTKDLISDFYNSFNNTQFIKNNVAVTIPSNVLEPTLDFVYGAPSYETDFTAPTAPNITFKYETLAGFGLYLCCVSNYNQNPRYWILSQFPYTNLVNYQISGQTNFHIGYIQGNKIIDVPLNTLLSCSPYVAYSQGIRVGYTNYEELFYPVFHLRISPTVYDTLQPYPSVSDKPTMYLPFLANRALYLVNSSNEIINTIDDAIPDEHTSVSFPNQDDDNNNPIIPFVPFPDSPNNPNGFWGTLVDDILDGILDGLETALIAALIDEFTEDHGGDSIMYDDDVTNYYYYYDIKNDIKQQSEELPIDLNEISLYTDNTYLTTLKESVGSVSDVIHDYVGFWYDVDPTVVIVILGSAVLSVVTLLLHKMGG